MEVAASIVGLLAAATNVYTTLSAFLTVCHDAPTIAQTTSDEVRDFRYALLKLRDYVWQSKNITLLGRATTDTSQLILTLASAMTTLAQVEKTLDPLLAQPKMDYIRRIRWGFADSDLSKLLTRIQCHKLTLNLLLTIWLSESAAQAEASNDLLNDTLKGLLDPRYQGPSQFLHPSIYNPSTSNASGHTPHTSITVNPQGPNTSARHSGFLMSGSNTFSIKSGKSLRSKLQNTKPYSGLNAFNSSAQSVLTSERATSWSQSQFTIGSNISVFSLPFTGFDLDTKTISEVKEIHRISLPVDGIALYNKWWYPKMNIASKLPTGELCTFGLKIGMNEYADLPSTSKWNSESPTFVRGLIKVFDRHVRVGGTRSSFLRTRLNSAIFRQHLRLIDLLLSWCAQNRFAPDMGDVLLEAFRVVVELGHGEVAEQFLEWGAWIAVVYQKLFDGTFELAIKSHNIEIVKMFLVHGASPEKGYGKPPYTPSQGTTIGRNPVALAHLLLE